MNNYPYFDTHCDTLKKMQSNKLHLNDQSLEVNLRNMHKYRGCVQVFAYFCEENNTFEEATGAIELLRRECDFFGRSISFQTNALGIKRALSRRRAVAIAAVESVGNIKDFTLDAIDMFHKQGVRFVSLGWNNDNVLCGGADGRNMGLTSLGRECIKKLEQYKMILDVSHMSDKSFYQAAECYSLPICASHSSSRSVCPNKRNITDDQFRIICQSGGVCGVNFYPPHLGGEKSGIDDAIKHIEHFLSLGGEDHVGIGSDFDGMDVVSEELKNQGTVQKLFDRLLSLNYSENLVNKVAFYNFYKLMSKF